MLVQTSKLILVSIDRDALHLQLQPLVKRLLALFGESVLLIKLDVSKTCGGFQLLHVLYALLLRHTFGVNGLDETLHF